MLWKNASRLVVVLLRDRVDLVIVAAGAVDRQAEEDLAGGRDDVVEPVVAGLLAVGRLVVPDAQAVEAGGDERVGVAVGQLVAGELLADERSYGLSALNERMT